MVVHTFKPRQEDLWVWGQPSLQSKFQKNRGTQRTSDSKTQNKQTNKQTLGKMSWHDVVRQGTSDGAIEFIFYWLLTAGQAAYPYEYFASPVIFPWERPIFHLHIKDSFWVKGGSMCLPLLSALRSELCRPMRAGCCFSLCEFLWALFSWLGGPCFLGALQPLRGSHTFCLF